MPPVTSLRIAVLGGGAIGSALAFQLARAGRHHLTLIARPGSARLAQLQRDQAIVDSAGARAAVRVTDTLDRQIGYDLVIVTVLAHQVEALLPALRESAATSILFMFNNFEPERLRDAIGAARCGFGMPFIQAMLDPNGRLTTVIGALGQTTRLSEHRWVDWFNGAGLPAVYEAHMPLWLRCHAPLCVAFESVSVAAVRRGGGASWRQAMARAHGVRQSFTLIRALGYRIYPSSKARLEGSPAWVLAAMLWAMSRNTRFRTLLSGGAAECAALVDAMLAAAPHGSQAVAVADIAAMKPTPPER
ncbi:MAG: 2-dehydropantoate 2-reductase N-terminal domain-containing protein [Pseudomonadota bacterium]